MVWDRGTYTPRDSDVGKSWRAGRLTFVLRGRKLNGEWILVRTGARGQRTWLLMKHGAEAGTAADVLERAPRSVKSNRLMAEIAFDEGGDVERAARTDPPASIRALLRDPDLSKRTPRKRPAVWQSNRSSAAPKRTRAAR
jgi:bifunctional non-homologous end joining protein LigD